MNGGWGGGRTVNRSDRPSRRLSSLSNKRASHPWHESRLLHSGASAAPGWRVAGLQGCCFRSRSVVRVGATPATPVLRVKIRQATASPSGSGSRLKGRRVGASCCLAEITPQAPLKGGCGAGPMNITRHYAHGPHARASPVNAARGHNAALCINGPECAPPTPAGGL